MNKRIRAGLHALGIAAVLTLGLAATAAADAHPRGRINFGLWVGGPLWWGGAPYGYGYPYSSYPYVVERPIIMQAPAEPVVVQPSVTQQANTWYYCREAQMYYPYVTSCASPWQEVAPTPPPAAPAPTATTAPATRGAGTPVPAR